MSYINIIKERIQERKRQRESYQYNLLALLSELYDKTEQEDKVPVEEVAELLHGEFGVRGYVRAESTRVPFGVYYLFSGDNCKTIHVKNKCNETILTVSRYKINLQTELDKLFRENYFLIMDIHDSLAKDYQDIQAQFLQEFTKSNQKLKQKIDKLFS